MHPIQMCSKYRKQPTIAVANATNDVETLEFSTAVSSREAISGLPTGLQAKMEAAFGQNFANVRINKNSRAAINMGALAYAQNEEIHFAPGQFDPNSEKGRHIIGHEFTHIAQQRRGLVRPTAKLDQTTQLNSDAGLENEADQFGKKAVRGEKIGKYHTVNSSVSSSESGNNSPAQQNSGVVQMIPSHFGEFNEVSYTTVKDAASTEIGVEMYMKFEPGALIDAESIGMVQTVRSVDQGALISANPLTTSRSITAADAKAISSSALATDEGIHIDQYGGEGFVNPLYATGKIAATDSELFDTTTPKKVKALTPAEKGILPDTGINYSGWGEHGYRYKDGEVWKEKSAELRDRPKYAARTKNAEQRFETTALALKGNQKGSYYGSVEWGWTTDSVGKFAKIPLKVVSQGTPSSTFMKAAEIWNAGDDGKGNKNMKLPAENVEIISNFAGVDAGLGPVFTKLPYGTRVVVTSWNMVESDIRVVDGPHIGLTATVPTVDISDER